MKTPNPNGGRRCLPDLARHAGHEMKHDPRYHPLRGGLWFETLLNDPKNNAPLF